MSQFHDKTVINGITIPSTNVHMIRQSLGDINPVEFDLMLSQLAERLPNGYRIRTYQPNDAEPWTKTIRSAERFFDVDDGLFARDFGTDVNQLSDRMYLLDWIDSDGTHSVIGTATAWWKTDWQHEPRGNGEVTSRGEWGQVHWVAIHPEHQGKGLAKVLMAAVMNRLAHSHQRAMLGTSTARIWAVKVYLDLGFLPESTELTVRQVRDAWQRVQQVLKHPALTAIL